MMKSRKGKRYIHSAERVLLAQYVTSRTDEEALALAAILSLTDRNPQVVIDQLKRSLAARGITW